MNGSTISELILLGFTCSHKAQLYLLVLVLACYTTILLGNFLIMVTVWSVPQLLQSPMYFFLTNLSFIYMSFGSLAAPKLVTGLLNSCAVISYGGCMVQLFGLHLFVGAEMFLLTIMAYDHYVATCHPLRYTAIMDQQRCFSLLMFCWTGAFIHSTVQMVVIAQLPFCGSNVLGNFLCDIPQVDKMSSVFCMVVIPALNPLIYTLRNQDKKGAMGKLNNKFKLLLQPQRGSRKPS